MPSLLAPSTFYSEDQPRDEGGRFGSGGLSARSKSHFEHQAEVEKAIGGLKPKEEAAIDKWSADGWKDVRASQKAGKPNAEAKALEGLIARKEKEVGPTQGDFVRGRPMHADDVAKLKEGAIYHEKALSSWTTHDHERASGFADSRDKSRPSVPVVLHASKLPASMPIGSQYGANDGTDRGSEKEHLVSSKARFEVTHTETDAKGILHVHLKPR
jgi:hypothetical protein